MIITFILIIVTILLLFLAIYCHENKIISDRQYRTYAIVLIIIAMLLSMHFDNLIDIDLKK